MRHLWLVLLVASPCLAAPPEPRLRLGSTQFRPASPILALRYLPDGEHLLVCEKGHVLQYFKAGDGARLQRRQVQMRTPTRYLLRWDAEGNHVETMREPLSVASPDGRLFAELDGRGQRGFERLRVQELRTGKVVFETKDESCTYDHLQFSPDSRSLAALRYPRQPKNGAHPGAAISIRFWELASGKETKNLLCANLSPEQLVFAADGKTLAALGPEDGKPGVIRLWDLTSGKTWRLEGQQGSAGPLAFSPNGRQLAEVGPGKLRLWDVRQGKQLQAIDDFDYRCLLLFSPDGTRLVAGSGERFSIFAVRSGEKLYHAFSGIGAVLFSPDGRTLALGEAPGTIRLLDAGTLAEKRKLAGQIEMPQLGETMARIEQGLGCPLAFSPDGKTLAAGSVFGPIRRWDVATGTEFPLPGGNDGIIKDLAFSPDGRLLAAAGVGVSLWDARTGQQRKVLAGLSKSDLVDPNAHPHLTLACRVAFAPRGEHLAAGWADGTVAAWHVDTGRQLWQDQEHCQKIAALQFLGGGDFVAADTDGRIFWRKLTTGKVARIWQVPDGIVPVTYQDRRGRLLNGPFFSSVALSPGGRMMLTSSGTTTELWETETGQKRRQFNTIGVPVLSPDGRDLACRSTHGVQVQRLAKLEQARYFAVMGLAENDNYWRCIYPVYSPDGKLLASFNNESDRVRLWDNATGTLLGEWRGHLGGVTAVALAHDNKTLAVAAGDGTIALWDLPALLPPVANIPLPLPIASKLPATDLLGQPLPPKARARLGSLDFQQGQPGSSLRYLPDGKTLLTGAFLAIPNAWQSRLSLWDLSTGQRRQPRDAETLAFGYAHWTSNAALTPEGCISSDGHRLVALRFPSSAGTFRRNIQVQDLATGKTLYRLDEHDFSHFCLAPTGGTLAAYAESDGDSLNPVAASEAAIYLHDEFTGKQIGRLQSGKDTPLNVKRLTFSPNGHLLAALGNHKTGEDALVRVWHLRAPEKPLALKAHSFAGSSVAFAPDSKTLAIVSAAEDSRGRLLLLDTGTGKVRADLGTHAERTQGLVFSPDGKWLASLLPKQVRLWDLTTGKETAALNHARVKALVFSPDSRLLALGDGKTLTLYQLPGCKSLHEWPYRFRVNMDGEQCAYQAMQGFGWSIAFAPDGKALAALQDGGIRRWDLASGSPVGPELQEPASALAMSADGRLIAALGEETAHLWDASTGKVRQRFPLRAGSVARSIALAADGQWLAVGNDKGDILLWSTASATPTRLRQHRKAILSLAFSAEGRTLTSTDADGAVCRWDLRGGRLLDAAPSTKKSPHSFGDPIALSLDGRHLLTKAHDLHLWDTRTGRELRGFAGKDCASASFSADGRLVAIGCKESVRLHDVATGTQLAELHGHRGAVTAVAFAPDGRTLLSSSKDTTVLCWDVLTPLHSARPATLSAKELEELWQELGSTDAALAYQAQCHLHLQPEQTIGLLRGRLAPEANKMRRLLANLESPTFATRQKAMTELERLGDRAETALRQALAGKPTLEVHRRLETLLAKVTGPVTRPETLRALRAMEVLHGFGTPEARALLEALRIGAPQSRIPGPAQH